jgi:hypothetical protein
VHAPNRIGVIPGDAADDEMLFGDVVTDLKFAATKGPVVRSPDSTKYRIVAANGGALSTVAA